MLGDVTHPISLLLAPSSILQFANEQPCWKGRLICWWFTVVRAFCLSYYACIHNAASHNLVFVFCKPTYILATRLCSLRLVLRNNRDNGIVKRMPWRGFDRSLGSLLKCLWSLWYRRKYTMYVPTEIDYVRTYVKCNLFERISCSVSRAPA